MAEEQEETSAPSTCARAGVCLADDVVAGFGSGPARPRGTIVPATATTTTATILAPAIREPYLSRPPSVYTSANPHAHAASSSSNLAFAFALAAPAGDAKMNRSWHYQMQIHRNYLRLSDTSPSTTTCTDDALAVQHPSPAMDPTTLVTFLFKAPPEARTVELLGSWDNFSRPYRMEQDRRRGSAFWSGCFKFDNIIFDGDRSRCNRPRSGALKQGGTYWYYYRLNDDVEAFDHSQEHTTNCPLLPGQPVNVIEVPVEIQPRPKRRRSASMDVAVTIGNLPNAQTLEPKDKFEPLYPPPPSKVHGRCLSDCALNGRLENHAYSLRPIDPVPSPPMSRDSTFDRPVSRHRKSFDRYYNTTYDSYPEGRNSLQSQRSWHSSAPSHTHSSTYDEYQRPSFDLTPVKELPSSRAGLGTAISYIEDVPYSYASPHHTATYIEDVEPWLLDQSNNPQPFSTSPDALRPTTSHGRPTNHPATWDFQEDAPAPNSTSYPRPNPDSFDVLSPSFSAATISTTGIATPFRLSLSLAPSGAASVSDPRPADASIHQLAERLKALSEESLHREEAAWSTYTLPQAEDSKIEGPEAKEDALGELGYLGELIVAG